MKILYKVIEIRPEAERSNYGQVENIFSWRTELVNVATF